MKLISCHIINFGGLAGYDCRFDPGLTVLMEPNGSGKTTLAEFIRAMFYGFPRASRDLEKNRRKKYLPWQGGTYGGNLVFEHEGVQYRIERAFGERPASDTFALYDLRTNRRSDRFSENIGIELFQLDADSFERSTYLPQLRSDIASLSTDSIQAKLGDLVDDTNDVNNYEAARNVLLRKRSALIPFRGAGGLVEQAYAKVSELEERISAAKGGSETLAARRDALSAAKEALDRKIEERDGILEKISQASQAAGRKGVMDRWRQLRDEFDRDRARERQLAERYPEGFPGAEQVELAVRAVDGAAELSVRLEPSQEYLAARSRLDAETRFASGVPSEDDFQHYQALCSTYEETRASLRDAALPAEDADRLARLEELFSPAVSREPPPKTGWASLAVLILGVLSAAAGAVLLFLRFYAAGGCLAGLGVILLIAAVYLRLKDMLGRAVTGSDLAVKRQQYADLKARRDAAARRAEELTETLEALGGDIAAFLAPYAGSVAPDEFRPQLNALQVSCGSYLRDRELVSGQDAQRRENERSLRECRSVLSAFSQRYGLSGDLTRDALQGIKADIREHAALEQSLEKKKRELGAYYRENESILTLPEADEGYDLDELKAAEARSNGEIKELSSRISELERSIRELQEEADQIPALEDEQAGWIVKLDEGRKNAALLDAAIGFLERAKESLSASYLTPIRQAFDGYLQRLTGESAGHVSIDPALDVTMERGGAAREIKYFSAGQSDAVMLCMRLALVDALFKGAEPFLILDDPFVNLDDERTAAATRLLKDLARDRQIIYLVCNSSRGVS